MADITELTLSYPDFVTNTVIDPEEFDQNNTEIVTKVNEVITSYNTHKSATILDHPDDSVTTAKILDANVTTAKIADDNVTTAKIAASAVTATEIANDAVTTAKILNQNVTTAKIADANVTTAKIADANITTAKILDANITTDKIANSAVTNAKVASDIVATKIVNTPAGNVAAVNIQTAINELDSEKVNVSDVSATAIANKVVKADANAKIAYTTTGHAEATDTDLTTHKSSSDHDSHIAAIHYTKTEMQTSGSAQLHWGNLTNVPNLADSKWKAAVANRAVLPLSSNEIDDMRVVLDDGDGKQAMYVCIATTGDVDAQWGKMADLDWTNDHGNLVGLNDDDHSQYHNDTRGDLRYYTKSEIDTNLGGKSDTTHDHEGVYVTESNGVFDTDVDFQKHKALNLVEDQGVAFPATPAIGQRFYRTDLTESYIYKGAIPGWVKVTGRGAVPRLESFTASLTGAETFTLLDGVYEIATNSVIVFVNGHYTTHTETSISEVTVTVATGDSVVIWYLENSPEVINLAVQKDGMLQTNLNADLLDGQHGSYYAVAGEFTAHLAETVYLQEDEPEATNSTTLWFDSNSEIDFSSGGVAIYNAETSTTPPETVFWFQPV